MAHILPHNSYIAGRGAEGAKVYDARFPLDVLDLLRPESQSSAAKAQYSMTQ